MVRGQDEPPNVLDNAVVQVPVVVKVDEGMVLEPPPLLELVPFSIIQEISFPDVFVPDQHHLKMLLSSAASEFFAGIVHGRNLVWSKREEEVLTPSENLGCREDDLMPRIGRDSGPTLPAIYVEDAPIIPVAELTQEHGYGARAMSSPCFAVFVPQLLGSHGFGAVYLICCLVD